MSIIQKQRGILAVRAEASDVMAEIQELNAAHADWRDRESAKVKKLEANLVEMEQRLAERDLMPRGGAGQTSSMASAVSLAADLNKDGTFQQFAAGSIKECGVKVSATKLLNVQANVIRYDSGDLAVRENVGVIEPARRRRWLRDRLTTVTTTGGTVEFSREASGTTNNADVVGAGSPFVHEGADKPESVIEWDLLDLKVPTIATYVRASRQILSDAGELGRIIDRYLRHFLELKLEQQIITGTGTGAQMKGLTHADNRVAFTPTSGDTGIESISRALGTLANSYEIQANLVILNPVDYRAMQRTRAVTDGQFLWGDPNGANSEQVWAVDIHQTPAMTQGSFAITDTEQVGTFRLREDAQIMTGYTGNQFTQNLVTILGELRALLTVERPTATMYGSLTQ